jgi:hypothetical protein
VDPDSIQIFLDRVSFTLKTSMEGHFTVEKWSNS